MALRVSVWRGRRVMVRLGAVLCGSVMYGLVWQVRFVVVRSGMAAQVVVWQEWHGALCCDQVCSGSVGKVMAGYKRR